MKSFINYILEAKLEPGGEDLGKLFGSKGRYSPTSKDAPKEGTAHQRMVQAARMKVGDFGKMITGIFGPPSGDVKEPETKSNADLLRDQLRAAGKAMKDKDVTPDLQKKIDAVKGQRGKSKKKPGKKSEGNSAKSMFNLGSSKPQEEDSGVGFKMMKIHDHFGATHERNPKPIEPVQKHYASLVDQHRRTTGRTPSQKESADMAREAIGAHFDAVTEHLKKNPVVPGFDKGTKFKISKITQTRVHPIAKFWDEVDRKRGVEPPPPQNDGHHLIVQIDHPSILGSHRINEGVDAIGKHLRKLTGHTWVLASDTSVKTTAKEMIGSKKNPLMFSISLTHPHIDRQDGDDYRGGGDDGGGPDEPTPVAPRGPRGKKPQLV